MLAKANGLSQYSVAHVLSFRRTAMSGLESRCKVPRGPLDWGRRISAATRARGEIRPGGAGQLTRRSTTVMTLERN
jgi:hypothetical protein